MIRPVWKLISLILSLGVFLTVGIVTLSAAEELIWIVGKAVAAFVASWIVLNTMGGMLLGMLEKQDELAGGEAAPGNDKG